MLAPSASAPARFRHALRLGRLRTLERLGLAEEIAPGAWRLSSDMEPTLYRLGERGNILKALHREMACKGRTRSAVDYAIYDPADAAAPKWLVGRVVAAGVAEAHRGVDGRR